MKRVTEKSGGVIGVSRGEGPSESGNTEVDKGVIISFRGKVMSATSSKPFKEDESLDGDKFVAVSNKQGDKEPPAVEFMDEGLKALTVIYHDAIVVKLFEKHISYTALVHTLKPLEIKGRLRDP
ncbi:hypothetical protein PIB30_028414 [Stylosanthes scabra]|uniref:Uncharacterized protein n=1 Tax=Stylosanthes scabra TaxID=79078 RepID=A0ABU6VCK0_9FABA|nr:hypothetical protein [Stylosanthes scabra]